MTDNLGRFTLAGLAAGRYTIGATKPGFLNVIHGQGRVGFSGRAIPIKDGEHRQIRLELPRPGVITGVVVDEGGNPLVNATVRAVRFSMSYGYPRPDTAGSAVTDDRGIYRIHSLQPGDLAVCASTRHTDPLNEVQRRRMDIDRQRRSLAFMLGPPGIAAQKENAARLAALEAALPSHVQPVFGYAPVCHPGNASLPSRVRVAPDEERTGVDFRLVRTRLARIAGSAFGFGPDAQLDPILLLNVDETVSSQMESARLDIDGRFLFTDVTPGRYRIVSRGAAGGTASSARIYADTEIVVGAEDIDNLVLQFQRGATIAGQLVFRGTSSAHPPPPGRFEIRIEPAVPVRPGANNGLSIAPVDESGRFELLDVIPGAYRVTASSREATGWFLESSTLAGQDVLVQPLTIKSNDSVTGVVVTLTNERAELTGTILNDLGEPAPEYFILVYPTDEQFWSGPSRRLHATRARPDGRYAIVGLRGGSYRLATVLDVEFGAWFDPAFVRQLESVSMPLTIADRDRKVLNLRVPK